MTVELTFKKRKNYHPTAPPLHHTQWRRETRRRLWQSFFSQTSDLVLLFVLQSAFYKLQLQLVWKYFSELLVVGSGQTSPKSDLLVLLVLHSAF